MAEMTDMSDIVNIQDIPGLSNTARFYNLRYEEACDLFEDLSSEAWIDVCYDLLEDEQLSLAYRVVCHYMYAHASPEPRVELQKGRAIIRRIESMLPNLGWLSRQKEACTELEKAFEEHEARGDSEDENDDADEMQGVEEQGQHEGQNEGQKEGNENVPADPQIADAATTIQATSTSAVEAADHTTPASSPVIHQDKRKAIAKRKRDSSGEESGGSDKHVDKWAGWRDDLELVGVALHEQGSKFATTRAGETAVAGTSPKQIRRDNRIANAQ